MSQLNRVVRASWLFISVCFSLLLPLCLWAAPANNLDSIVAVVNDQVITNSQLQQQIAMAKQQNPTTPPPTSAAQLRQQVLQHMIDREIQLQVAKKMNITVDDTDLDQAISNIAQRNGLTLDQLKQKLQQQGMAYDQYREEIRTEMLISQVQQREIAPHIRITDQEVTDFIDTHGSQLVQPPVDNQARYHVVNLIVPLEDGATQQQISAAQQAAQALLNKLKAGANPQQLITSSMGTQFNVQTNDLGWHLLPQLPDLYVPYVKTAQAGSILGPVQAPNGFHIIDVVAVQGQAPSALQPITQTHVRHILLKTNPLESDSQIKARLEQLRAAILNGADFGKIAMANSQDPGSAGNGGDIGWVVPQMLDAAFANVMNQTAIGQISEPFKSQFGWHILQVLGRRTVQDKQELMRDQAKQLLYQQKFNQGLQNWLQGLRSSSYIRVM